MFKDLVRREGLDISSARKLMLGLFVEFNDLSLSGNLTSGFPF